MDLLEAQRHAFLVAVDVQHHHFDFLPHFEQFARMAQTAPAHVGDVQQAVHAVQVHERTEVGEVLDGAAHDVAGLGGIHETAALVGAFLLNEFAAREHHVLAVVVDFDDFKFVRISNKLMEILWRNDVNLRAGQECLNPDVHRQAALDHRAHLALDDPTVVEDLNDLLPVLAVRGAFLRKDDHPLVVFQTAQQYFDLVAHFEVFHVFEFRQWNDAFALVPDIDQYSATCAACAALPACPNCINGVIDDDLSC